MILGDVVMCIQADAFTCIVVCIKGKLGEDVGQLGIRVGDSRVSHTTISFFSFYYMPKVLLELLGDMHC